MTVWYKINPNRFTYRELWRMSGRGLWPFAKAVWRKWLDVQTPPTSGFAIPASPVVVDLGSLPERPRKALGDMIAEVERHGFRFVFCHQGLHLGDVADYTAVLISAGETTLANAGWFRMGVREEANFALGSRTEERRLLTRNDPHRTDSPPEFDVWHLPGKSIGDLILAHSRRLERLGRERVLPAREGEIVGRIAENQSRHRAFHLARGVYTPMAQEEIDRLNGVVIAIAVVESGNPFQPPREDEPAAQAGARRPVSRSALGMSICSGFAGGAIFGVALGAISLRDALDQGIPLWALFVGYFIVTPLFAGGAGAVVGLACWAGKQVFRRLIP